MNLITTTELRTKTKNLIDILATGQEVKLVHRSKIVATIKPQKKKDGKKFDPSKVLDAAKKLNLENISYKEAMKRYRKHIINKYGKGLS